MLHRVTLTHQQARTAQQTLDQPAKERAFSRKDLLALDALSAKLEEGARPYNDGLRVIDLDVGGRKRGAYLDTNLDRRRSDLEALAFEESDRVEHLMETVGKESGVYVLEEEEKRVFDSFFLKDGDQFTNYAPLRKLVLQIALALESAEPVKIEDGTVVPA